MANIDQLRGTPFEEVPNKKIPGSLNTLTILTFIGSGFFFLLSIYQQFTAKKSLEMMEKMQGSEALEKMPAFFKNFYTPEAMEMVRTSYEYRIPLFITTLIGLALCVYGAIQMRKLKKQGFFYWLIGEIFPLIVSVALLGVGILTGFTGIFGLIILFLFIFLYSRQLKYLS